MPLHTLITDLIDSQGGSSLLIKALNHLGVCSSADVLARFIQHKADTLPKKEYMNHDSFTIISADNIDFLHSYASVFQGSRNSSWHGTTIQAVQPLPSLSQIQQISLTDPSNMVITSQHSRKKPKLSPFSSPLKSPVPKSQRRVRTGNEKKNTTIDDNHQLQLSTISQPQQPSSLTLADYDLQGHELQSFFQVQKSLNLYILCHNAIVVVVQRFSTYKTSFQYCQLPTLKSLNTYMKKLWMQ